LDPLESSSNNAQATGKIELLNTFTFFQNIPTLGPLPIAKGFIPTTFTVVSKACQWQTETIPEMRPPY